MKQFLVSLHEKIKLKMEQMPGLINDDGYGRIRDFKDFDDRYTAPINGSRTPKITGSNAAADDSSLPYRTALREDP
jgi:hypothetical protein